MGERYGHLSFDERATIARLSSEGRSIHQIASALDRSASTISRELKRNTGRQVGYQPGYAQEQAKARRWKGSRLDRDAGLRDRVLGQLMAGWSPEQVAGRSRLEGARPIGTETIYRFVHAQIIRHKDYSWRHLLPRGKYKRGLRLGKGGSPALHMHGRIGIEQRPDEVRDRSVPGHWEADLMAFSRYRQNILMLHDRMSRILVGSRLTSKQSVPVAHAIRAALEPLPGPMRKTLTFDNGTEFAAHGQLHPAGIATYFCAPHAPWQKGGIENAIGRMRRFLPRKTDLATLEDTLFTAAILRYNNTPRKCLGWKTPAEVFAANLLHFERESTSPPSRE
jgi:IS30 family transposase